MKTFHFSGNYIYIYKFIIGNWLTNNGGWEVPKSSGSKPETQNSQWCKLQFESWQARDPGRTNVSGQVLRQDKLMPQLKQVGRKGTPLPLCGRVSLFVLFRPSIDWMRPTHSREGNRFTQSTSSNDNLTLKTRLQAQPEYCSMNCPGALWPSHTDTKWTIIYPRAFHHKVCIFLVLMVLSKSSRIQWGPTEFRDLIPKVPQTFREIEHI